MLTDGPQVPLCVHCRRQPVAHAWRPFCSERCKLLDLARWADESYRVPGARSDDEDEREKVEDDS
jgi:hypothetical protein